jgi:hypothetical protein
MYAILILIGLAFGSYKAIQKFNDHCAQKFGHVMYSTGSFVAMMAACGAIYGGVLWTQHNIAYHLGGIDGPALVLFGGITLIYKLRKNIKYTNLAYGISATCFQIPLCIVLAPVWFLLFILASFGFGALSSIPTRVRIIN